MATMSLPLLHRAANEDVTYSVVELGDVRRVFATALPAHGNTLEAQEEEVLQALAATMDREGMADSIIQQVVLLAPGVSAEACRRMVRSFFGEDLPATTYVRQRPCNGKLLAIEAWAIGAGEGRLSIDRPGEGLVVAGHDGISWIHCGQVDPTTDSPRVYDRSLSALAALRSRLAGAGVRFEQVVRTWLHLGDIVGMEGEVQRYRELNRARADFFEGLTFFADRLPPGPSAAVYPASTGIGVGGKDVTMSCIALATDRPDVLVVPLENPRQTSAFNYAASYSARSPKFARGLVVSRGTDATIFVSGTASITRSESRHVGNPVAQTHEALNNILALIAEDNLARHGLPGLGTKLDDLAQVRVYVKRPEDYVKVRAACEARLGDVPAAYVVADVCRPELLVEVEGVALSRRGGDAVEEWQI